MHEHRFARVAGSLLVALLFGACGSDDKEYGWETPPELLPPTIISFEASPGTLTAGGSTVLAWQTRNAEGLILVDGANATIPIDDLPVELGSISIEPAETTSYRLIATGRDGLSTSRTVTVLVQGEPPVPPTVERFAVTPEVVATGASVTLSWKTTGANTVTIKDDAGVEVALGDAVAEGQVSVKPTRSPTVYDLTASGPGGRATAQATVTVTGQPRVVRFDVSPIEPIDVDGQVTLTWETSNVTKVVIEKDGQPFLESTTRLAGSEQVNLAKSAVFTLKATSATGAAEARAEAKVGPRILAFSSSERLARIGDTVTFSWNLEGADRATIDGPGGCHLEIADINGAGNASGSDFCVVTDQGDYVLRAFRGDVFRIATVHIGLTAVPRIRDLAVAPHLVTAAADHRATVTLSWRQSGAVRCTIYVNGQPVPDLTDFDCSENGSAQVPVTNSSLIRLDAVNDDGSHSSTASVDAVEPARIDSFLVIPDRLLGPGDPAILKWSVTDAVSVSMEKNGERFEIDDRAFHVDELPVRAPDLLGVDSYRLTAVNSLDDPTHATVMVRVGAPVIVVRATPDFVALDAPFVLNWLVDGGDELTVTGPDGDRLLWTDDPLRIASGSEKLNAPTVAGIHKYTVTAKNGAGSWSADVEVTASDGPMILSFTVDRSEISLGESLTFSWRVEDDLAGNPPTLTLTDHQDNPYPEIGGKDRHNDSVTITPGDEIPYVFTLTASTGGDRIPARASLSIDVTAAPVLASFTASLDRVSTDGGKVVPEVTLSWRSEYAVELMLFELDDNGNPSLSPFHWISLLNGDAQQDLDEGSIVVRPTATTWYLARIRSRVGTVVERVVEVVVDAPEILSFVATPSEVVEGETIELSWVTRNATSAFIDPALEYIDIANQPFATRIDLFGSSAVTTIQFPNGFTFPFEGSDRFAIQASTDGWLGFNLNNTSAILATQRFPNSANVVTVHFALFGCDLHPHNLGELWSGLTSDVYGPMFVIQYKNWSWSSATYNPSNLNFELVLRPDGRFEYRYGKMTTKAGTEGRANGESCHIGYQGTAISRPSEYFVPYYQALPGGLAYKSFVRPSLPAADVNETRTMNPSQTTIYTLTAINDDAETVAQTTVTVWKRPTLTARVTTVDPMVGRSLEISWTTTEANGVRVLDAAGQPICDVTDPAKVASGSCIHVEPTAGVKTFTVEALNGPSGAPVVTTATTLFVSVYSSLAITSFTVAPNEFAKVDDRVTLTWATAGAYEVRLYACPLGSPDPMTCPEVTPPNANPAAGSVTHEMATSSEFWLVAYDTQYRSVKAMQNVWVGAGEITRFDASSTQILAGDSTTLTWTSTDHVTAVLTPRLGFYEVKDASFVDIADTATIVNRAGGTADAGYYDVEFPSGFAFPWFGEWKKKLRASTDGWITFDMNYTSTHAAETNLPSAATFKAIQLAPFWDNLNQGTGSLRYKLVEPLAGERHLVIEWHGFRYQLTSSFGTESNLNFQVVLFESGTVDFRYGTMESKNATGPVPEPEGSGPKGYSACMGWQSPDMTQGEMLVNPRGAMQGGLQDRSWRFPIQLSPNGSVSVSPAVSTTYKLCATNPTSGYVECREVRVLVIQSGDVLISELMIEATPQDAEWLELRNMSPDEIDLEGWTLSSGSKEYTILSSVKVKPGGYAVFARSGEPSVNGGLVGPHVYGDAIHLDDATGDVKLSMDSKAIDEVTWNNTWPIQANKSIAVEPTLMTRAPTCNDLPTAWCATTALYGDQTFGGSPGTAGEGCLAAP